MKKIILLILLCLFLTGCDDMSLYKITRHEDGAIIKMNRLTGEITIIKDGKITTEEEIRASTYAEKAALEPKGWRYQSRELYNSNVTIKIKLISDKLYYEVEIIPRTSELFQSQEREISLPRKERKNPVIILKLYDEDSFELIYQPIPLVDMTRKTSKGGEYESLDYAGSVKCDRNTYANIKSGDLSYSITQD